MERSITIEEMKKMQIEILQSVHKFCKANHIRYTLFFGTLLGAIRHKGYIPWDDDIDIALSREDYERFIETFIHDYYKVYDYRLEEGYANPYAKVADTRTILEENTNMPNIGINIDVFPIDYLFDTLEESKNFISSLNRLKTLYRIKLLKPSNKNVWWKRIAIKFSKIIVYKTTLKEITKQEYKIIEPLYEKSSEYVGMPVDPEIKASLRSICKRSFFENYTEVEFEGEKYMAIADYDKWLTQMYGDYMTPPSGKNRTSPHILNKIYWKG